MSILKIFKQVNIFVLCFYSITNGLKINGANFIKRKLISLKTELVFGYPGGCNLKLFDELFESEIKIITNRNEQCSAHSAEAYSKTSNKLGICITTSGPGLTNTITALQDAQSDGIPLLLISGQVSSDKLGLSAFQECNSTDITKSCVKKNLLVKDINTLVKDFDSMINEIYLDRKGPVHIDICSNVFSEEIEIEMDERNIDNETKFYNNIFNLKKNTKIEKINKKEIIEKIKNIKDLILQSKKPILIVGQGCKKDYKIFRYFIEKYDIPVCSTLHGLGIVESYSKYNLGMIGMHGSYAANMAVSNADLIIGIGNRFDDRTIGTINTFGSKAKKSLGIVHIDNSISKINEVKKIIKPRISLNTNSKYFLETITSIKKYTNLNFNNCTTTNSVIDESNFKQNKITWLKKINKWKKLHLFLQSDKSNLTLTLPYFINKLSTKINKKKINPIVTTGVGVHQMQVAQYFKFDYPNNLITSGSYGTMGVGLPFAIGCQLAEPDKLVLCIDGDGSFQMTCSDIATLVEYNLPIKIIIVDNSKLQMVGYWQKKFYNSRFSASKLLNPNFSMLANSYGIEGIYCDNVNDLDKVIDKIIDPNSSLLVHLKISDTDCLPFVPPNKALDQMILN